jgi:comEA protein
VPDEFGALLRCAGDPCALSDAGSLCKEETAAHPVNLNTASSAELQPVPGIGPATAEKILRARKSCDRFKSVDDLQAVRGLGPKRPEKLRKYLTVDAPPQSKKRSAQAAASSSKAPAVKPPAKTPDAAQKPPATADDEEEP